MSRTEDPKLLPVRRRTAHLRRELLDGRPGNGFSVWVKRRIVLNTPLVSRSLHQNRHSELVNIFNVANDSSEGRGSSAFPHQMSGVLRPSVSYFLIYRPVQDHSKVEATFCFPSFSILLPPLYMYPSLCPTSSFRSFPCRLPEDCRTAAACPYVALVTPFPQSPSLYVVSLASHLVTFNHTLVVLDTST